MNVRSHGTTWRQFECFLAKSRGVSRVCENLQDLGENNIDATRSVSQTFSQFPRMSFFLESSVRLHSFSSRKGWMADLLYMPSLCLWETRGSETICAPRPSRGGISFRPPPPILKSGNFLCPPSLWQNLQATE